MHPLKNRNFRLLFATRILANLTVGFFEIAVIWWLLEKTGNKSLVAYVALFGSLSFLLAAPLGGTLADRLPKKLLIHLTYGLDIVLALIGGFLLLQGWLNPIVAIVLMCVNNLAAAFRAPALQSLLPMILKPEQYQQANASMGLANNMANLASLAVAGVLVSWLGSGGTLFAQAVLLGLAALCLAFLHEPTLERKNTTGKAPSVGSSMAEGFKTILGSPALIALVTTATLLNFIVSPLGVLMAPYAKELGANATAYGLLGAAVVAGQLLGLVIMNVVKVARPVRWMIGGTLGVSGALLILAVAPHYTIAALGLLLAGSCAALINVQLEVFIQKSVSRELLGRAYGVLGALSMSAQPAGFALAGVLLGFVSIPHLLMGMALLLALAATAWLRPQVQNSGIDPQPKSA
jgi:MFS transporter, DHA3 family, macrolide efflux protein